jgi:transcriptional regulator with XRE-family HTH domain
MNFDKKLKNLRELASMSQAELAKAVGVSTVMISQYENGKKMPGRETVIRIAEVFGISSSDLLGDNIEGEQYDEIIILNRAAKKMTPENRKKLLEMAKVMFKEDFED